MTGNGQLSRRCGSRAHITLFGATVTAFQQTQSAVPNQADITSL